MVFQFYNKFNYGSNNPMSRFNGRDERVIITFFIIHKLMIDALRLFTKIIFDTMARLIPTNAIKLTNDENESKHMTRFRQI